MTYTESFALQQDPEFRGRIQVGALKYADSILIEVPTTPGHSARLRWAATTFQQPGYAATQLQPAVVMDSAVQAAGAAIEDSALQGAIEAVVNKIL